MTKVTHRNCSAFLHVYLEIGLLGYQLLARMGKYYQALSLVFGGERTEGSLRVGFKRGSFDTGLLRLMVGERIGYSVAELSNPK